MTSDRTGLTVVGGPPDGGVAAADRDRHCDRKVPLIGIDGPWWDRIPGSPSRCHTGSGLVARRSFAAAP
jgi:hypothetical protein